MNVHAHGPGGLHKWRPRTLATPSHRTFYLITPRSCCASAAPWSVASLWRRHCSLAALVRLARQLWSAATAHFRGRGRSRSLPRSSASSSGSCVRGRVCCKEYASTNTDPRAQTSYRSPAARRRARRTCTPMHARAPAPTLRATPTPRRARWAARRRNRSPGGPSGRSAGAPPTFDG